MSQHLGRQNHQEGQIGQCRATLCHATCPRHLQAGSTMPRTRLTCVGFQAAGAPATGRQKDSKDHLLPSRPTSSKDVSSTGQQSQSAAGTPKQAVPVEPRGALQEASGNAVAAKQQDAERMQAADEASTSGREYWQVMRPSLLCHIRSLPFNSDRVFVILSQCPRPKAHHQALHLDCSHTMGSKLSGLSEDTAAACGWQWWLPLVEQPAGGIGG